MLDATHYTEPFGPTAPAERVLHPGNWVAGVPLEQALTAPMGAKKDAVVVRVDLGRWIVECPDCGGAQLTARKDRRFMCCECANVSIGVKWRPVLWPADHHDIEAQLDAREISVLQNWNPGETTADLVAENELLVWLDATKGAEPVDWSGHTHTWDRADDDGLRTCVDCKVALPASVIEGDNP